MSHGEILERVFPLQKRSVLLSALATCQGDLAKTIDHFITLGDNMVSIQNQLQSDVTPLSSSSPATMAKSAFTPITTATAAAALHQNAPPFDFRPSLFFSPPSANHQSQRENHLPLLPPPPPPLPPTHQFPGLYPPVNFLHHFAQTHPVVLAAAYEKLLKRHQQETAAAAAAANKTGDR